MTVPPESDAPTGGLPRRPRASGRRRAGADPETGDTPATSSAPIPLVPGAAALPRRDRTTRRNSAGDAGPGETPPGSPSAVAPTRPWWAAGSDQSGQPGAPGPSPDPGAGARREANPGVGAPTGGFPGGSAAPFWQAGAGTSDIFTRPEPPASDVFRRADGIQIDMFGRPADASPAPEPVLSAPAPEVAIPPMPLPDRPAPPPAQSGPSGPASQPNPSGQSGLFGPTGSAPAPGTLPRRAATGPTNGAPAWEARSGQPAGLSELTPPPGLIRPDLEGEPYRPVASPPPSPYAPPPPPAPALPPAPSFRQPAEPPISVPPIISPAAAAPVAPPAPVEPPLAVPPMPAMPPVPTSLLPPAPAGVTGPPAPPRLPVAEPPRGRGTLPRRGRRDSVRPSSPVPWRDETFPATGSGPAGQLGEGLGSDQGLVPFPEPDAAPSETAPRRGKLPGLFGADARVGPRPLPELDPDLDPDPQNRDPLLWDPLNPEGRSQAPRKREPRNPGSQDRDPQYRQPPGRELSEPGRAVIEPTGELPVSPRPAGPPDSGPFPGEPFPGEPGTTTPPATRRRRSSAGGPATGPVVASSGAEAAARIAEAAPPAPHGRAGRNLPAAIGVGVLLGGLALGTLFTRPEAFVALVSLVVVLAVWELSGAMAAKQIVVPVIPLAVGSLGMLVSAYVAGEEGLLVSFTLTGFGVLLWRIVDGMDGALRDVTAGLFTAAYVPLLAGFAILLLADDDGPRRVVTFIVVTVASDIGGYVAGVIAGKTPMAPTISPKKSWEGFAGSVVFCLLAGVGCVVFLLDGRWWVGLALGAAAAVCATLGDLSESLLKRDLGVKDMGSLLPGHGGIMDRLDSLLPTAPVAYLLLHFLVSTT